MAHIRRPTPVRWGGWCQLSDPVAAEIMASAGFDWICVDAQHGLLGTAEMVGLLQAVAVTATPAYVRTASDDPRDIMRVLDAGGRGVIVPNVNDQRSAAKVVAASRYPPAGVRSWGPVRAGLRPGFSAAAANAEVECYPMIETAEAVERVREIAGTPGLTGLFVGPIDLQLSCTGEASFGLRDDDQVRRLRAVVSACSDVGIVAGIFAGSARNARLLRDLGFSFIALQADTAALTTSSRAVLADVVSDR